MLTKLLSYSMKFDHLYKWVAKHAGCLRACNGMSRVNFTATNVEHLLRGKSRKFSDGWMAMDGQGHVRY